MRRWNELSELEQNKIFLEYEITIEKRPGFLFMATQECFFFDVRTLKMYCYLGEVKKYKLGERATELKRRANSFIFGNGGQHAIAA